MDQLSPPRMCDPWAVYTAKSFADDATAKPLLTEQQKKILEMLKETGGTDFEGLVSRLGVKHSELERELATLRHMEKIKASMRNGKKILVLW
jgi:predicted HTH transcriptional regulator